MHDLGARLVWWNALAATGVCLVASGRNISRVFTHWNHLEAASGGVARLWAAQVIWPFLSTGLLLALGYLLWQRTALARGMSLLAGVLLLVAYGLGGWVVAALAADIYGRDVYRVNYYAMYLGASLLVFAFLGSDVDSEFDESVITELMDFARQSRRQGNFTQALESLDQVLSRDPGNAAALKLHRQIRREIGQI